MDQSDRVTRPKPLKNLAEPYPRFGSEQPSQHGGRMSPPHSQQQREFSPGPGSLYQPSTIEEHPEEYHEHPRSSPDPFMPDLVESSGESDADDGDRDYRPGATVRDTARAAAEGESQYSVEVEDAIEEAQQELVNLRFNGTYGTRGYGVFTGKLGYVPFVAGRGDDIMTSLSSYKAALDDPRLEPELARQHMDRFQRDIFSLADQLFHDEDYERTLHPNQEATFKRQALLILLTMSKEIVQSIIKGDLPRVPFTPQQDRPQAKRILRQYQLEREGMILGAKFQPAIYAQYLCCNDGRGPRSEMLSAIMDKVEQYITDGEYAHDVDLQVGSPPMTTLIATRGPENMNRRYLKTGETRDRRIPRLREFVEAVRNRLPEDPNVRPRCLAEYGFTNNFKKRLDLHARHEHSNFIMNLVDAICQKDFSAYGIHQYVVYSCWAPQQGWVAEILINRLGMGYTSSGYGFSYHPTGRSNASAAGYTSKDYYRWAGMAHTYTPFKVQADEREKMQKDDIAKFNTEVLDKMKEKQSKARGECIRLRAEINEAKATMARWVQEDNQAIKEADDAIAEAVKKNASLRRLAEAVAKHGGWLVKDNADTEG
ncbi:hypothetical protein IWX90DRAFT_478352 [Phyllosticta citrichinensis]|uniref:Uncharacterized protein n=1 Tax=Phyllosticta citrichinensis TaxID=1130410 RepID=A0ABR1XV32_9PEZI